MKYLPQGSASVVAVSIAYAKGKNVTITFKCYGPDLSVVAGLGPLVSHGELLADSVLDQWTD